MNYPNIEDIDPIFKDYIVDALKERERIEKALLHSLNDIFVKSAERIIEVLLKESGLKSLLDVRPATIKSLSPTLLQALDDEESRVGEGLFSTIQTAIFSAIIASLTPLARLKLDAFLNQQSKAESLTEVPNKNVKSKGLRHALPNGNLLDQQSQAGNAPKADRKSVKGNGSHDASPIGNLQDQQEKNHNGNGAIYALGIGWLPTYSGEDVSRFKSEASKSKASSEYLPKMKSIQRDIIAQASAISKSSMHKRKVFRDKEFKLSDSIWDKSKDNVDTLKKIIEQNINKDVTQCAKAIDLYVKKGFSKACREYPNMMRRLKGRIPGSTSFAAYRLARNEIAEITFRATLEDYADNPFVEAVKWLLANNRLKQYEDKCCCNELAYEDKYGLGHGIFPLDKVPDRPHVMCLCTVAPISSRRLKKAIKDGLQIGNVPTKEWLDSMREEKDAEIIKDKDNRFAFNIFQNEDDKVLKTSCIDAITSHDWFIDGVQDIDKEAFLEDLNKLTSEGLFLLARYTGEMQAELYHRGASRYNIRENKIYTNLLETPIKLGDNKALGYKLGMATFLHETGHWLDSNITGEKLGLTFKMEKLYSSIRDDVLNAINKAGKELYKDKFTPLKELNKASLDGLDPRIKNAVTNKISANIHINSNISDMYGALTQNEITGKIGNNKVYGHADSYWQCNNKTEYAVKVHAEFIAEAFESLCSSRRIEAMQKYLPSAWKEFTSKFKSFLQ